MVKSRGRETKSLGFQGNDVLRKKHRFFESQMGVRNTAKGSKIYLGVLYTRQKENGILKKKIEQSKRGQEKREKII